MNAREPRPKSSEWTGAEVERLHYVVGRFRQWYGVIDRQRAERGSPGQADTDRRAHHVGVRHLQRLRRARKCRRSAVAEYAAGIDKGGGPQTIFLRYARNCALQFRRRCPIHAAADIIHGGAGREIAWAEPVGRKASHHARAAEEAVGQRHLLSAPTGDVAALATDHSNQVVAERLIVARVLAGSQELHVATKAREILPELRIDAVGRA